VAVLNTATGTQPGATLALAGNGSAALSPDGAHALIFTEANVAAINTVTGTATTAALTGSWALERWSADGSRALISSRVTDAAVTTTRVAVIDTTTGQQTGTTITMPGAIYGSQLLSADGTHALITTSPWNPVTYTPTTQMAVINTTTGKQVGGTLTLAGGASGEPLFSADGTHILITTAAPINGLTQTITRVAVLRIV
jgi:Tol biopolymer transport system component